MLNIFKINKVLKQATKHVEEVNQFNDELTKIGKEQNEIIAQQHATIEALQKQLSSSEVDSIEEVYIIDFEHFEGMTASYEDVFASKELAVNHLLGAGYVLEEESILVETYLNEAEKTHAFIYEKHLVRSESPRE